MAFLCTASEDGSVELQDKSLAFPATDLKIRKYDAVVFIYILHIYILYTLVVKTVALVPGVLSIFECTRVQYQGTESLYFTILRLPMFKRGLFTSSILEYSTTDGKSNPKIDLWRSMGDVRLGLKM